MEPVIKVRHKMNRALLILAGLLALQAGGGMAQGIPKCAKSPLEMSSDKSVGDNGFAVLITGSPRLYRPDQIYTLTLRNIGEEAGLKFQGFMLVAEASQGNTAIANGEGSLGTLQTMPGDAMVKFSHRCSHAVEATSSISKEEVKVYWTAPPRGSGCIDFKAMIEERKDVWYSDEGSLTYTLCEDDSPLAEPPSYSPCCACDEAKYEVIFEGIWSRHTHPKDFPPDEWRTEFSQIIGASHSWNYSMWEYGRQASPALQLLGEKGFTTRLEGEMKRYSPYIRSVIKAHGLQQRSNVAGQTFAVFRVDPQHHLLSFVSKMIPSPDWVVGLSKENLCNQDCTWVANRVIDLYPWDIGTESGLRYDSPSSPLRPRVPIQRITSSNPNNPESPFFDISSAPMKPAARLHIIKQREYSKACPPGGRRPHEVNLNTGINPGWTGGAGGMGMGGGPMGGGQGMGQGGEFGGAGQGGAQGADYGGEFATPQGFNNDYGSNTGNSYTYGTGIGQPTDAERYGYDTNSNYDYDGGYGGGNGNNNNGYNNGGYGNNNGYGRNAYGENGEARPENEEEEDEESGGGFLSKFFGGNKKEEACKVHEWEQWAPCSATCGRASRHRVRQWVNPPEAEMENCAAEVETMEKEPCGRLPKCEARAYGGIFQPFGTDEESPPSSNYWSERGLKSDGHRAPVNSYTYETGRSYPPAPSGSGNSYGYGSNNPQDNYNRPDSSHISNHYGNNQNTRGRYGRYYQQGDEAYREDEEAEEEPELMDQGFAAPERLYGNSYMYGGVDENGNVDRPQYSQLNQPNYNEEDEALSRQNCQVTQWGDWSDCSTSCGAGRRTRTRRYVYLEHSSGCSEELDDVEPCMGEGVGCPEDVPHITGLGFGGYGSSSRNNNPYNSNPYNTQVGRDCQAADWSEWSPCSKKCGMGTRRRTRLFLIPFVEDRTCDVRLIDKGSCYGTDRGCSEEESYPAYANDEDDEEYDFVDNLGHSEGGYGDYNRDSSSSLFEIESLDQHRAGGIDYGYNTPSYNDYDSESSSSLSSQPSWGSSPSSSSYEGRSRKNQYDHICNIQPDEGPCSGFFHRWHYDPKEETCKKFIFRGCNGNRNNFPSKDKCMEVCGSRFGKANWQVDNHFGSLQSLSSIKVESEHELRKNSWRDPSVPAIDCQVSAWSEWSECSTSCGMGWISRERHVMVAPSPGGRACPRKLVRRRKCKAEPCPVEQQYFYQGSWRHMVSNDDIRPDQ